MGMDNHPTNTQAQGVRSHVRLHDSHPNSDKYLRYAVSTIFIIGVLLQSAYFLLPELEFGRTKPTLAVHDTLLLLTLAPGMLLLMSGKRTGWALLWVAVSVCSLDIFSALGVTLSPYYSMLDSVVHASNFDRVQSTLSTSLSAATLCIFVTRYFSTRLPLAPVEPMTIGGIIAIISASDYISLLLGFHTLPLQSTTQVSLPFAGVVVGIAGVTLYSFGVASVRSFHTRHAFDYIYLVFSGILVTVYSIFVLTEVSVIQKTKDDLSHSMDIVVREANIRTSLLTSHLQTLKHADEELLPVKHPQNARTIHSPTAAPPGEIIEIFTAPGASTPTQSPDGAVYTSFSDSGVITIAYRTPGDDGTGYNWATGQVDLQSIASSVFALNFSDWSVRVVKSTNNDSLLVIPGATEPHTVIPIAPERIIFPPEKMNLVLLVLLLGGAHFAFINIESMIRLKSAKALLSLIKDESLAGLIMATLEGNIIEANRSAISLLGISVRDPYVTIYRHLPTIGEKLSSSSSRFTTDVLDGDGNRIPVTASSQLFFYEGEELIIITLVDRRDEKQIQDTLQDQKEQLEAILSCLSEGVMGLDNDGVITFVNTGAEIILNASKSELLGLDYRELIHPVHLTKGQDPLLITQGKRRKEKFNIAMGMPSGERFTASLSISPLTHGEGQGAIMVFENESEREKAARLQTASIKKLEELNRDLEEFNHLISHDLREPARTVSNYAELVEEALHDGDMQTAQTLLDRLKTASIRMHVYMSGLKAFSSAGAQEISLLPIDVHSVIDNALFDLKSIIDETNADITIEEIPSIFADYIALTSVFQNLIGNAIKYVPKGTTPRVAIWGLHDHAGHVNIYVKDNGIGIDADDFDIIFKPFRRLHGAGEYHGSGIGLAIVKRFVDKMHGSVSVLDSTSDGTTFKLRFIGADKPFPNGGM